VSRKHLQKKITMFHLEFRFNKSTRRYLDVWRGIISKLCHSRNCH